MLHIHLHGFIYSPTGDHGEISSDQVTWRKDAEAPLSGDWYKCTQTSLKADKPGVTWANLWAGQAVEGGLPLGPITKVGVVWDTSATTDRVRVTVWVYGVVGRIIMGAWAYGVYGCIIMGA